MKKKLLVLTSVIVVVLAVVGLWGYSVFFRVNPKVKQQLYHQFGANFFNTFPDSAGGKNSAAPGGVTGQGAGVKPGGAANFGAGADPGAPGSTAPFDPSRGSAGGLSASTGTGSHDPGGGVPGGTSGGSAPGNPNSSLGSGAPLLTEAGVVGQYLPEIRSLQSVALSRLDTLYAAAVQEYREDKAAGTLNRAALAQKYIQAGNLLEANVDNRFYSIMGSLHSELVSDGLPTDEVGVIKSQYEAAKAARRSAILGKALRGR
ncbi:Hypothetical protein DEACI_3941 [Acididesulfobacillus acetoxydans]|uniref:Uncharacterized protein n=1 Tax=Acididesulfobacillus acetoxydans TaxID=1561005 RepID=A0A8S0W5G4_9FIRM|nr:hypothetical protein [Acididesulfobacillus acetoxydans]CAA7603118.1 Hypothetical protein DEACI_3941 [Acididesulfobacillus acetoxydans]CEJ05644.1 Hypothetical protein DEACI_0018 [Acididesulfobacillus acetoxydans]